MSAQSATELLVTLRDAAPERFTLQNAAGLAAWCGSPEDWRASAAAKKRNRAMPDQTGPEGFLHVFGAPNPPTPSGIAFDDEFMQEDFEESILDPIGAGWFWDRFLFLWGEGVETYERCLEAWHFALPPHTERMVVGRNAYGALLVNFDHNDMTDNRLWVVDPFGGTTWNDDDTDFMCWVYANAPRREWRNFFDRSVYDAWLATEPGVNMAIEHALVPKLPIQLGGTFELSNFQLEPLVEYYENTAPIFEKNLRGGFEPGAE